MLKNIFLLLTLFITIHTHAEDINVNVNNSAASKANKKYEVIDGTENISGAPATLKKTAEHNWTKACESWKTEFKELNLSKNNTIISHNCGKMDCTKTGVETACSSKAQYKVKTLKEE